MRIGLIACCKEKLDHPAPAEELYCSHLFKLSKAWITKRTGSLGRCQEWGILSAKYGLVMPDQVIEPYDLSLHDLPRLEKERWSDMVYEQLVDRWSEQAVWLILMGAEYKRPFRYMPYVEDVTDCWTQWRIDKGMTRRRASIGIGVLKRLLKNDTPYY